jgi:hypothetical protein
MQSLNVHVALVTYPEIPCKFPARSLLSGEICGFWAESGGLGGTPKKIPAFFPCSRELSVNHAAKMR